MRKRNGSEIYKKNRNCHKKYPNENDNVCAVIKGTSITMEIIVWMWSKLTESMATRGEFMSDVFEFLWI